ncbi:MAG TPA: hypothetical protein VIT38_03880, partial [Allosphingosinicella sp.]
MTDNRLGLGCAVVGLALNTVLMGLLASQFARGPYASQEQEIWYRYGSLGFLLIGVILPAVALVLGTRRFPTLSTALAFWMAAVLFVFIY